MEAIARFAETLQRARAARVGLSSGPLEDCYSHGVGEDVERRCLAGAASQPHPGRDGQLFDSSLRQDDSDDRSNLLLEKGWKWLVCFDSVYGQIDHLEVGPRAAWPHSLDDPLEERPVLDGLHHWLKISRARDTRRARR